MDPPPVVVVGVGMGRDAVALALPVPVMLPDPRLEPVLEAPTAEVALEPDASLVEATLSEASLAEAALVVAGTEDVISPPVELALPEGFDAEDVELTSPLESDVVDTADVGSGIAPVEPAGADPATVDPPGREIAPPRAELDCTGLPSCTSQ
jgi:hypothetical protein